jgi:anti-anti-sigma factor
MPPCKRLALSADLTIYQATAHKQQMLAALAETDLLELDLAQVAEIDSAGLQLLLMIKRESDRQGKRLSIVAHSPEVRQTIDFCHLATYFGDPVMITAQEQA